MPVECAAQYTCALPLGPQNQNFPAWSKDMSSYLIQVSYSTEALAGLIKNPHNRTEAVRKSIEKLGGKLTGFWLAFGDYDVVVIAEMPDNIKAVAMSMAVAASGTAKSVKTTPLLSAEEGVAALKKAGNSGYKPAGAKK
jgi:uncharacterized protein with GYD domain